MHQKTSLIATFDSEKMSEKQSRKNIRIHRKHTGFIGLIVLLLSSNVYAQNWEKVDDPQALKALFSDTVIEATLKNGVKTVARYNRDGTGELEAWGDTFPRTWEVRGEDQVCFGISDDTTCYEIERNIDAQQLYRAKNLSTGETFEMTVEGSTIKPAQDLSSQNSGGAAQPSANEIAAELANPNTPLATLTLKNEFRWFDGDLPGADGEFSYTAVFQPSLPFSLSNGDMIFFRPAIPFHIGQPVFDATDLDFDSKTDLGDISFDLAYGQTTKGGNIWAAGLVTTLPTATSIDLGSGRYSIGPEVLFASLSRERVLGALVFHQWDVAGWSDNTVNRSNFQPFATALPGNGWNYGTGPKISYDWHNEQWTVPLNFNVGKTVMWKGKPWKLSMEINYYVERSDTFAPEWMVGFSIAPVVKNVIAEWFK